jgi:hypothetical protein
MSNFCQTCQHWNYTYPNGTMKFGTCQNDFATDKIRLSQDYDTVEVDDPVIYTESCFGCIYYEKKGRDLGVVEIKISE